MAVNLEATRLNDQAQQLCDDGKWQEALPLLQQVFLTFGKDEDPGVRSQVARALYHAALCYRELGRHDMARQVQDMLVKRFSNDASPRARYWVELARTGRAPDSGGDEVSGDPDGLDRFLAELLTTKSTDAPAVPDRETIGPGRATAGDARTPETGATGSADAPVEGALAEGAWAEGAARGRDAARSSSDLLLESEVTLPRLKQLFDAAYLDNQFGRDGDLRVQTEAGKVFITLDEPHQFVRLVAVYGLRQHVPLEQKLALANALNGKPGFVRFCVANDTSLVADYALSYAQGVAPRHIIGSVQAMHRIIQNCLKESDSQGIVA